MPVQSPARLLTVGVPVEFTPPGGGPFSHVYVANQSYFLLDVALDGTERSPLHAGNNSAYTALGHAPASISSVRVTPSLYPGQAIPADGSSSAVSVTWYEPREQPPGPGASPLFAPAVAPVLPLPIDPVTTDAPTITIVGSLVTGDTVDRWRVRTDGTQEWGPGNAAADVTLLRDSTGRLTLYGSIIIGTDVAVGRNLAVTGTLAVTGSTNLSGGALTTNTSGDAVVGRDIGVVRDLSVARNGAIAGNLTVTGTALTGALTTTGDIVVSGGHDIYARNVSTTQNIVSGSSVYAGAAGAFIGNVLEDLALTGAYVQLGAAAQVQINGRTTGLRPLAVYEGNGNKHFEVAKDADLFSLDTAIWTRWIDGFGASAFSQMRLMTGSDILAGFGNTLHFAYVN